MHELSNEAFAKRLIRQANDGHGWNKVPEMLISASQRIERLVGQVAELEKALASERQVAEIGKKFHDVAVSERNLAQHQRDKMQARLQRISAYIFAHVDEPRRQTNYVAASVLDIIHEESP